MEDPAIAALQALVTRTEGGRAAVAAAIHANEQTLYQILARIPLKSGRPRGLGRDLRERLTRAFPNWLDAPTGAALHTLDRSSPPYLQGAMKSEQAQSVSLTPFNLPTLLTWEGLMLMDDLPELFSLAMPDDAMAPRIAKGTVLIFGKNATPTPGAGVLVKDREGRPYVRRYRQGRGNSWEAQAINETAFSVLDSERDGLSVVAVLQGMMSGLL